MILEPLIVKFSHHYNLGIEENNFCEVPRLIALKAVPGLFIAATLDFVFTIFLSIGMIFTLGRSKTLTQIAGRFYEVAGILALPFICILFAINPKHKFDRQFLILTERLQPMFEQANELSQSENKFQKYFASRIVFFSYGTLASITSVVDLCVGIVAGIFAVLALGKSKQLNSYVMRCLYCAEFANTFLIGIINLINPFAKDLLEKPARPKMPSRYIISTSPD